MYVCMYVLDSSLIEHAQDKVMVGQRTAAVHNRRICTLEKPWFSQSNWKKIKATAKQNVEQNFLNSSQSIVARSGFYRLVRVF
jgi:hypothetical protein